MPRMVTGGGGLALVFWVTSLVLVFSADPFIFQVQNAELTVKLLKKLNYQSLEENLTISIFSKLLSWEEELAYDPFLFENPLTNFLLLTLLRMDIQTYMIPISINQKFRRTVRVPTRQELRKSAVLINDMTYAYSMSAMKGIVII